MGRDRSKKKENSEKIEQKRNIETLELQTFMEICYREREPMVTKKAREGAWVPIVLRVAMVFKDEGDEWNFREWDGGGWVGLK